MKLDFELVPDSCWYSNLRSILSPEQWDVVRREAYARAGGKCSICGGQSPRLEAHEQWEYDEKTATQKLKKRNRRVQKLPRSHTYRKNPAYGRRGARGGAFYES